MQFVIYFSLSGCLQETTGGVYEIIRKWEIGQIRLKWEIRNITRVIVMDRLATQRWEIRNLYEIARKGDPRSSKSVFFGMSAGHTKMGNQKFV